MGLCNNVIVKKLINQLKREVKLSSQQKYKIKKNKN